MRRLLATATLTAALLLAAVPAWAGSPHFVTAQTALTQAGSTLTVTGKEAGLGDELQVHLVLTATAQCVNPGGNKPNAANKQAVTAAADVPVQSGKADFTLTATAAFQPECSPPMTVEFSNVVVTDETNGISLAL